MLGKNNGMDKGTWYPDRSEDLVGGVAYSWEWTYVRQAREFRGWDAMMAWDYGVISVTIKKLNSCIHSTDRSVPCSPPKESGPSSCLLIYAA